MTPLRSSTAARRTIGIVSALLLLAGVGLLAYPLASNLWRDEVQDRLEQQFASPELKEAYEAREIQEGDSLTRIKIPALGVDTVVVEGITASALRAGAGHYPQTALPCELGNVAIAGHRTTYGKPFADIDRLSVGDTIELITPVGGCVYTVSEDPFVVSPEDVGVLDPTTNRTVTLTTCHPRGSNAQRLIVRGQWEREMVAT